MFQLVCKFLKIGPRIIDYSFYILVSLGALGFFEFVSQDDRA